MRATFPLLTFSIDLELAIDQQGDHLEQRLELLTTGLVQLFERQAIAATWAVADPVLSAATAVIRASKLEHELAVLGDRTWAGLGAGRIRFARELLRRVERARAIGLDVRTLALRNVDECNDIDLLAKAGIVVVRASSCGQFDVSIAESSRIHQSEIASVATAWRFPQLRHSRWWGWEAWSVKRRLCEMFRKGQAAHIAIDVARLVESAETGLGSLEKLLTFASRQRSLGRIAISTLVNSAPAKVQPRLATPAHSVLRPAA